MQKKQKTLLSSLIIIVILALVGGYVVHARNDSSKSKTNGVNTVSYDGPTKEEKAAGDDQKKKNEAREQIDASTSKVTEAKIVTVDASQYSDSVEVRAYIANLYESDGTCTVTFTLGDQTLTKTVTASKGATTTQCATLDLSRSEFSTAGNWQYVISYKSAAASGTTTPQTVVIK